MTVYGTLQTALDRFGLGRPVSTEAFTNGLFGKNVGIVTDADRGVLRGHPWPANSDEQSRRERFWASCKRAAAVEVPRARLRAYVLLDLVVIWEFAVRQTPPWVPGGTFEAWATSFIAPVDVALDGSPSGQPLA